MSKRPFDPDKLTNELSGASSFFKPQQPTPNPANQPVLPAPPSAAATPEEPRTPVLPVRVVKRQMIRHPFEIYADQLERLRDAAQIERAQGASGSMSKMVRDAIDQWLDNQEAN
jgi:hypothetical protein